MIFATQGTNNRSPGFGNPERHQPMSMQGTGGTRGGTRRVLDRNPNLCQYLRVGFLAKCRDWNPSSDAKRPPSREGRWPLSIVLLWLCHCIPVASLWLGTVIAIPGAVFVEERWSGLLARSTLRSGFGWSQELGLLVPLPPLTPPSPFILVTFVTSERSRLI
jgi:hypothetical protein